MGADIAVRVKSVGSEPKVSGRRADLQGMRAIAVLTVLANHLFDWPSGGFVGVDVFFVLSGFFITGLLIKERTTKHRLSFRNFYIRRVKRILPSALLVLAVTVIGSYLLLPASRAKQTLLDGLYAALFGANFRFQAVGADYFQRGQAPSPLQHYWSLSIEEQFYFVWPALLALIFTITRRSRRTGNTWVRQWALFGVMSVIVAGSFEWAMFLSASDPNAAYFSTFTRLWELGVGAIVAIAGPWIVRIPSPMRPLLAYLGLAGVIGSLFLIDSTVQFPAPWVALPVLSTALVVVSFHGVEVSGIRVLTNRVARYFGDTSYTLYLWHWPVIILLLAVIQKGPIFYIVALALSFGLTAVTYKFYENPIRRSDWLLPKPAVNNRRIPALSPAIWGLIGVLGALAILVSILDIRYADLKSANHELIDAAEQEKQAESPSPAVGLEPQDEAQKCFGAPAIVTPGCALRNPDVPLQPSIDRAFEDTQGQYACYSLQLKGLKTCTFGYEGPDAIRIALVGDSKAVALLPAIKPILLANKWNLTTYAGEGCQLAVKTEVDPGVVPGGTFEKCIDRMPEIQSKLLSNHYDFVVSTSGRGHGLPADWYAKAWEPIVAAGSRVIVVVDNPVNSQEALDCLSRANIGLGRDADCGTPTAVALADPDTQIEAAQLVPGTKVIDFTPYYCLAEKCPSVIGDVVVYRDTGHATATFAKTLAGQLERELSKIISAR